MPLTVPVTLWALAIVGVLVAPPALLMLLLWRFWWRTRRDMSRAAEAFGLELETRFLAARQARGRVAGYPIAISYLGQVEIDAAATLPRGFAVVARHGGLRLATRESSIATGDGIFDERYVVEGDAAAALALLTPRLRQEIVALQPDRSAPDKGPSKQLRCPVRVDDGRITVTGSDFPDLTAAVSFGIALAEALRPPADPAARLVDNLRSCRSVWERLAILRVLGERYAEVPVARQALSAALTDPNEDVRLGAALGLGDEGVATLASIVDRGGADQSRSAHALKALGVRVSTGQLIELLSRFLKQRRHVMAGAVIESLATRTDGSITGRLTAVLAHGVEEVSLAAARALAARGDGAAEPALVTALESGWSTVRAAAAEALGSIGTASAVGPLRTADEDADPAVRDAARRAVVQIQARLPGADWGQVSLPEAEGGGLSVADKAPRGRVTIVERS
jgi:HEAT repeat protein